MIWDSEFAINMDELRGPTSRSAGVEEHRLAGDREWFSRETREVLGVPHPAEATEVNLASYLLQAQEQAKFWDVIIEEQATAKNKCALASPTAMRLQSILRQRRNLGEPKVGLPRL